MSNDTTDDIAADKVLNAALEHGLQGAIVIGYDHNNELYAATSYGSGGLNLWLLERFKERLMVETDQTSLLPGLLN